MAPPAPFVPTQFAKGLTRHMCRWRRGFDGSTHPMFRTWEDGVYPAFRDFAGQVARTDRVKFHSHAAAVTSSQMFAFNLFLPFRAAAEGAVPHGPATRALTPLSRTISGVLGADFRVERIAFEWVPPGALLGEIAGDKPVGKEKATGVDVVLWGHLPADAPAVILLEVKLGEGGFTPCKGKISSANTRPDVCASARTFLSDPTACYLQRPKHAVRDRRYWEIFARQYGSVAAAFPHTDADGVCPFAGDNQQPMRNFALARALEQAGVVSRAWFGLCPHDDNPDIPPRWAAWQSLLGAPAQAPVIPASSIIMAGREAGYDDWARWMEVRYCFVPPPHAAAGTSAGANPRHGAPSPGQR